MPMFVILVAIVAATSVSFFASADHPRGLSPKTPIARSEEAPPASRCAKKIVLPDSTETACLIQKRKGRA